MQPGIQGTPGGPGPTTTGAGTPAATPPGAKSGPRLSRALTRLGPAYLKLGQFLATRPDVVVYLQASTDTLMERVSAGLVAAIDLIAELAVATGDAGNATSLPVAGAVAQVEG